MELFDGFPYLVTRVVPGFYHLTVLPAWLDDAALLDLATTQVAANNLGMCLTLDKNRAVFFGADGRAGLSDQPPRGGQTITGRLAPPIAFADSESLHTRQQRLAEFIERNRRRDVSILGDLTKGGRLATPHERQALAGLNVDGSPRGLQRCETCSDWRGTCLDSSEHFRGQVMRVHCRCANDNRCARCGAHLYERRLNANYYERSDGQIWHVPGFCGLSHDCRELTAQTDLVYHASLIDL